MPNDYSIEDFGDKNVLRHAVRWEKGFQLLVYQTDEINFGKGVKFLMSPDVNDDPENVSELTMDNNVAFEIAKGVVKVLSNGSILTKIKVLVSMLR